MRNRIRAVGSTVVLVVATYVGVITAAVFTAAPAAAQVTVEPSTAEFPGGAMVQKLINWAGQFALGGSLLSLHIGAAIWGISQQFGNGYQSGKGKVLAASGAVGAVLTGLAAVIVNTLFTAARG